MNALAAARWRWPPASPLAQIVARAWRPPSRSPAAQSPSPASGAVLIDDSYNANPGSVRAAIDTLARRAAEAGWCWATCASWAGRQWPACRGRRRAGRQGIDRPVTRRRAQRPRRARLRRGRARTSTPRRRWPTRCAAPRAGLRVLVKGSRGSRMERVVAALFDAAATRGGRCSHAA
jgi:UDP-N-acetylmuramoyl-tripeptide--D-alanyl-D-alanine ligase